MDRRAFMKQAGILAASAALPIGALATRRKVFERDTTLTITWLPGLSPHVIKERLFVAFPEWPYGDGGVVGIKRGGAAECPYEWRLPVLDASKAALWGTAKSILEAESKDDRRLIPVTICADFDRFSLVMESPDTFGRIDRTTFSIPMADIDALFKNEDIPKEYRRRRVYGLRSSRA